ncbi:hypothetical protein CI238_13283 [Colletotrichum incanum]|uniref:Uncharacterized protein n=1 Tax=Colletotrichum incanum TaxID=1573173 RepID=A0A167EEJ4_COLIC|nr:hypothetical protein CI238_13283 [Colletotrichum incanum]
MRENQQVSNRAQVHWACLSPPPQVESHKRPWRSSAPTTASIHSPKVLQTPLALGREPHTNAMEVTDAHVDQASTIFRPRAPDRPHFRRRPPPGMVVPDPTYILSPPSTACSAKASLRTVPRATVPFSPPSLFFSWRKSLRTLACRCVGWQSGSPERCHLNFDLVSLIWGKPCSSAEREEKELGLSGSDTRVAGDEGFTSTPPRSASRFISTTQAKAGDGEQLLISRNLTNGGVGSTPAVFKSCVQRSAHLPSTRFLGNCHVSHAHQRIAARSGCFQPFFITPAWTASPSHDAWCRGFWLLRGRARRLRRRVEAKKKDGSLGAGWATRA